MKSRKTDAEGSSPQYVHTQTIKLLNALSEINKEFINPGSNKRALFKKLLNNALEVTDSEYGFMGEVLWRDDKPYLKTYAITDISWNEETAAFYKQHEESGFEFTNLETLFGYTLRTSEVVISNNPATDSRSGGRPAGHPDLNHYLGIPIKDSYNNMIGMMGLANKPGGYSDADITFLEPMLSLMSAFIASVKATEAKEFFSDTLEFYKRAIDSHSIVSVTDTKGKFIYVNDRFCNQYQYTPAELIGKDHRTINSGFHQKKYISQLWETIKSGKVWKGEVKNKAKDGTIYWEDKTIIPFLDDAGKPYQYISISNDITRLKEQEKELNNLFNLSEDFLIIANTNGYFLRVSASLPAALGYTEKELLSRPFLEFVHPEDVELTMSELSNLSKGINTFNFINRYICKDGSPLSLLWKASVSADDGRVYATATDITKQQEADRKLLQSKLEMEKARTKDMFLSNMSHEIRTPLNAIMGFNSLLANTQLSAEQKGYLDTMSSALKNLNVIINDILDLSKLESGKVELEQRAFNLEECVKQVVHLNRVQAKAKHLKLLFSIDPFIPKKIIGDETRLSQILMNLLSNAIKFTNKGQVEVMIQELSHSNNQITIQFKISDTGIGIEPEKLDMIFERFTQAEDYTNRIFGGTGLGLNIVKMLVNLHEGKMQVDSEVGKGTTFTFSITYALPTKQASDQKDKQNTELQRIPATILLVEDNFHNQQLACIYLERNGAKVVVASDGVRAIELLQEQPFDLVIMDIQMPVMDGIKATEMIRNELNLSIPVIGCSAHALLSEKRRCMEIGMNDYITKPYSELQLVQCIHQHLFAGEATASTEEPAVSISQQDDVAAIFQNWENDFGRDKMLILLNGLQKRLPEDVALLQQYLKDQDTEAIRRLSHQLVGSLGSLQLLQGMQLARRVETVATGNDLSILKRDVSALTTYLSEAIAAMQVITE